MKIVNMVATVNLNATLDLADIKTKLSNIESVPHCPWLKYRLKPEGYYIALYRSGKFLVTGVKSKIEIEKIAYRMIEQLKRSGTNVEIKEILIQNLIVTDSLQLNISLDNLISILDTKKASYEPEQFPGLIYKDWGVGFLLFQNGKFTVMGIKHENDISKVIKKFKEMITALQ